MKEEIVADLVLTEDLVKRFPPETQRILDCVNSSEDEDGYITFFFTKDQAEKFEGSMKGTV